MPVKKNEEEVIVNYFRNADLLKVEVVFNIIKGVVKDRLGNKPVKKTAKKTTAATSAAEPIS